MIKTETAYNCPICGQKLYTDELTLTSNPPQYRYWCETCDYDQYLTYEEVSSFPKNSGLLTPQFRKHTPPPKPGTTPSPKSQTPTYTPPPMPEVKPAKQRTVLSVRDFAILYNIVNYQVMKMEKQAQDVWSWGSKKEYTEEDIEKERQENMERLRQNLEYQDLLRIREKLGELNIEVETPSVEVAEL